MSNIKIIIEAPDTCKNYYEIDVWKDGSIWVCNKEGEGMGMSQDDLYGLIHEWFKDTH